jgi:hypothetical protein
LKSLKEVEMSKRAGRLAGALSFLALLVLAAAGLATAGSPPPPVNVSPQPGKLGQVGQGSGHATVPPGPVHPIAHWLTAKLVPLAGVSSTASGHWNGVLVHTNGTVQTGGLPSAPNCSVQPPRSQVPRQIRCSGGAVPPFTIPSGGLHWILGWRLLYAHTSSAVSGADIRINVPGAASVIGVTLCGPCSSGTFGHKALTDDQASALLKGNGQVVVRTTSSPDGEIGGQIVTFVPATHH